MNHRLDPAFLRWVHDGHLGQCLFCTKPATDWAHIMHGSHRTSDYLGYPACNACHISIDHGPRSHGERKILKDAYVRERLAFWFAEDFQKLMAQYIEETQGEA